MPRISPNVMLLGNGYFNFYVIGQEEAALVECGTRAGAQIFAEQWAELENKPNIRYIIALHSHFDHACGIPVLKQLFPEAQVVASAMGQKLLSKEKIVRDLYINDDVVSDNYLQQHFISSKPDAPTPETIIVDKVVGEGDTLELGSGLNLKILDAPGHSICSIAAYLEADQVLLVSDAMGYRFKDGRVAPVFFNGYNEYVSTIKKFSTYPAKAIGPAHGDIINENEIDAFYKMTLAETQKSFDYIKEKLEQGADEKGLALELFNLNIKEGLSFYPRPMMLGAMYLLINSVKAVI